MLATLSQLLDSIEYLHIHLVYLLSTSLGIKKHISYRVTATITVFLLPQLVTLFPVMVSLIQQNLSCKRYSSWLKPW